MLTRRPSLTNWTLALFCVCASLSESRAFGRNVPEWFEAEKAGVSATDLGAITPEDIRLAWHHTGPSTAQDLNIRAAELWAKIVNCQGSDSEAARKAYLGGENLCTDSTQSAILRGELKSLSTDLEQMLLSAEILHPYAMEWRFTLPVIHPLLSQLAVEVIATVHHQLQSEFKTENGKIIRAVNLAHIPVLLNRKPPVDPASRLFWNARRLLIAAEGTLPARGCARFGLWPNASLIPSSVYNVHTGKSEIHEYRGAGFTGFGSTDGRMPSCWPIESRHLALRLSSLWFDRKVDSTSVAAGLRHAEFLDEINAQYAHLRASWLK